MVPTEPRPGWWHRNWKWVVPASVVAAAAFVSACVLMVLFVLGLLKNSEPAKLGIAAAQANPAAIARLGSPIETGRLVSGSIETSGPSGHADLAVPVSGPRGKGTLYIVAVKSAGIWKLSLLQLEISGDAQRLDLLPDKALASPNAVRQ